jgi:hypothetical protein
MYLGLSACFYTNFIVGKGTYDNLLKIGRNSIDTERIALPVLEEEEEEEE